jgi:hypothetical protein
MEAFRHEANSPVNQDDVLVLGLRLDTEQAEQIGQDPLREFYFALSAVVDTDPSSLRWLAACAIQRSLELQA